MMYAGAMQGSTLLQVDCAPTAQLVLGITGVQRGTDAAARQPHAESSAAGRDPADLEAGASPGSPGSAAAASPGSALLQGRSAGQDRSLALTGDCSPLACLCKPHAIPLF